MAIDPDILARLVAAGQDEHDATRYAVMWQIMHEATAPPVLPLAEIVAAVLAEIKIPAPVYPNMEAAMLLPIGTSAEPGFQERFDAWQAEGKALALIASGQEPEG